MLASGSTFQRYRIEALLGSGGMGEVYRAYDPALQRHIALKVMRPDYAMDDGVLRAEAVARAIREAQSAAALKHPNAIAIYDVGEVDGAPFITMELVVGRSLRAALAEGEIPLGRKIQWLVQIARALDAAHRVGLIHRDVKPDNVMVCSDGTIKVLDFGIAKRIGVTPASDTVDAANSFETSAGRVMGTPRYMAPEQFEGEPVDARADQYSWGIVAYECIAGMHPSRATREPFPLAHFTEAPKPLAELVPGLPAEVAAVVARALSAKPALRFPSLGEAADALEPFAHVSEILTPREVPTTEPRVSTTASSVSGVSRVAMLVGSVGVLLLGAGVVLLALRHDPPATTAVPVAVTSVVSAAVASSSASPAPPPIVVSAALVTPSSATAPGPSVPSNCRCVARGQQLCSADSVHKPHICDCNSNHGDLCLTPVPVDGECPSRLRTVAAGLKTGDTCDGYVVIGAPDTDHWAGKVFHGTLHGCVCTNLNTFAGVQGGPCTGVDNNGATMVGEVHCEWH